MKPDKNESGRGFTLIELLVVIAIIAILSVVVVLTLNPAEMLRRSRDSNRASDLATIKTAMNLYLFDVSSTNMGTANKCYVQPNVAATVYEVASTSANEAATTSAFTACGSAGGWFPASGATAFTVGTSRKVDSTGWIPVHFDSVSAGAPLGQLPVDPSTSNGTAAAGTNPGGNPNAGHFYSYEPGANNQYKLAAKMESSLYSASGSSDLESADGGVDPFVYEQGSNLAL